MELKTFVLAGKLTLTVPESAIKAVDVLHDAKLRTLQGSVVLSAGGMGQLRARLDLARLVGAEDRDLDSVTGAATRAVFYGHDPIPILALNRLAHGGGDGGGSSSPSPAGPTLDIN